MSVKHQCPLCKKIFLNLQKLESHLKRKNLCINLEIREFPNNCKTMGLTIDPYVIPCEYCKKTFSRKDNLSRHLLSCKLKLKYDVNDTKCYSPTKMNELDAILELKKEMLKIKQQSAKKDKRLELKLAEKDEELKKIQSEIAELKEKKTINNQVLQVVCIGNKDNYLDMLTQKYNNFETALCFIKDCALSNLIGDCKLIEKIYFAESLPSIHFTDKSKTKIEYYNENEDLIMESKESFGKKIANNIQNSYLKGVNYLLTTNIENNGCPNKFLEEYDIQIWNQHIYDLSNDIYHKKIINHLNIPFK